MSIQSSLHSILVRLEGFFLAKGTIDININPDGRVWVKDYYRGKFDSGISYSQGERDTLTRLLADVNGTVVNRSRRSFPGVYVYETPGKSVKTRIQVFIPDLVSGPCVFFRLAQEKTLTLDDYVRQGIIDRGTHDFLRKTVLGRTSVIIAGATGSGKTTLINALIGEIPAEERVFIIEDTKEISCTLPNHVSVLTDDQYTYRSAVRDALRSSPERIIVGEVRDGAALDLLKAWNTGHSGLATIHANSAASVPDRLLRLCEEVVVKADLSLVAEAIDLIIFIEMQKGRVCIKEMLEPEGIAGGQLILKKAKGEIV